MGKSPVSYALSSVVSAYWLIQEDKNEPPRFQTANHLDYFRKEKGRKTKPRVFDDRNLNLEHPAAVKAVTEVDGVDRKTMARYNASSYEKNQLYQICSNPYDRTVEPPMSPHATSDTVPFDIFFKLVRPSFHKEFDEEDLMEVFKRSVFTEVGIYICLAQSERHAWPEDDVGMISPAARPTLAAYKQGNFTRPPASYDQDLQWSLNLLQAGLDGEDVPFCTTTKGTELFSGRKYIEEGRPTLAGIDGKTKYYLNEEPESATELPAKRLRTVKSSEALLSSKVELKTEEAKPKTEI